MDLLDILLEKATPLKNIPRRASIAWIPKRQNWNNYKKSRGPLNRTASTDPVLTLLEAPAPQIIRTPRVTPKELLETEDLRLFDPQRDIPKTITGNRARIIRAPKPQNTPGVVTGPYGEWYFYRDPDRVAICIRRRIRKEVAQALGWPKKKFIKPPNWTSKSYVSCADLGRGYEEL